MNNFHPMMNRSNQKHQICTSGLFSYIAVILLLLMNIQCIDLIPNANGNYTMIKNTLV